MTTIINNNHAPAVILQQQSMIQQQLSHQQQGQNPYQGWQPQTMMIEGTNGAINQGVRSIYMNYSSDSNQASSAHQRQSQQQRSQESSSSQPLLPSIQSLYQKSNQGKQQPSQVQGNTSYVHLLNSSQSRQPSPTNSVRNLYLGNGVHGIASSSGECNPFPPVIQPRGLEVENNVILSRQGTISPTSVTAVNSNKRSFGDAEQPGQPGEHTEKIRRIMYSQELQQAVAHEIVQEGINFSCSSQRMGPSAVGAPSSTFVADAAAVPTASVPIQEQSNTFMNEEEIQQCLDDIFAAHDTYSLVPPVIAVVPSVVPASLPVEQEAVSVIQRPRSNSGGSTGSTTSESSSEGVTATSNKRAKTADSQKQSPKHPITATAVSSQVVPAATANIATATAATAAATTNMSEEKLESVKRRVEFLRPMMQKFMSRVTEGRLMKAYLNDFYHHVARDLHRGMSSYISSGQLGYNYHNSGIPAPLHEIALYKALEVTNEFYVHYKEVIEQTLKAHSVNPSQPLPKLSMKSLKLTEQSCIRDLKGFTFATRYVPYLDHLVIPTIN